MRKVIDPQLKFGEQDIGAIHLDPKSRDDIPQILRGLQYIYTTPELRERVFSILQEVIPQGAEGKANPDAGRPGMEQWKTLVLGVLRQEINADYDRIHAVPCCAGRNRREDAGHTKRPPDQQSTDHGAGRFGRGEYVRNSSLMRFIRINAANYGKPPRSL